ncbi:MAG: helix-turn-helix domain-containing protein [Anaeromyxobacter sp.]
MRTVTKAGAPHRESYHHGDLRNALVEAAERLVARHGPEGFSLREAARDVGVSPAAAYRHFADKTALLTALAVEGHARLAGAMERARARAPAAGTPAARAVAAFVAIGDAYVEFAVKHPSHFRVMFGPALSPECFSAQAEDTGADPYQNPLRHAGRAGGRQGRQARAARRGGAGGLVGGARAGLAGGGRGLAAGRGPAPGGVPPGGPEPPGGAGLRPRPAPQGRAAARARPAAARGG